MLHTKLNLDTNTTYNRKNMSRIPDEWLQEVKQLLAKPKRIALTVHFNPDGDSLGSALGLFHYLKPQGHQIEIVAPTPMPEYYLWMPGAERVIVHSAQKELAEKAILEAEVVFTMDYNELARTNEMEEVLRKALGKAVFVMLDHHPDPEDFTRYLFSSTEVSSASELTYEFIRKMHGGNPLDPVLATCIFTGIMTDTGLFHHNSNNPDTYRTVAELLDCGIDKDKIKEAVFDNYSADRLHLLGHSLSSRLRIIPELRAGYIALSKQDLIDHNFQRGDHDGLVNYPLSVKNIRFSALIIEQDDLVKISMRSKGDFDVNKLMRDYFRGGGHKNASGGRSYLSLAETVAKLEKVLQQHEAELCAD